MLYVPFLINNYQSRNVLYIIILPYSDSVSSNNPVYLMFLPKLLEILNSITLWANANRDDYKVFTNFLMQRFQMRDFSDTRITPCCKEVQKNNASPIIAERKLNSINIG